MADRVFFVGGREGRYEELARPCRASGWDVHFADPDDPEAAEQMMQAAPVAAVFCLEPECSQRIRALAQTVVGDPRFARPLMIFVGGSPEEVALIKAMTPFAVFVKGGELPWVLKHLAYKE